jgi:DNA-binding winged helix-turn-helix (wHTH) protein/TolB-like protein/tetratricopeptide (TPR) repeat protein
MARDFYEFGPFRLDHAGRRLLRDGAPVTLTPKVFDTLLVLVEHHGQSLSHSELIARIWPETSVGEHNLKQSVAVLRKVLDDDPRQPDYIATLPGRGYSFIAEVSRAEVPRAGNGNRPSQLLTNGSADPAGIPAEISAEISSVPVRSAAERVASPSAINFGTTRRRWQYAAAGLAGVVLVAALTMASLFGSRIRTVAGPMIPSMRSMFSPASTRSVSVLPFEDLGISSAEPEKQYIASGLTQELTAELARLRELKVIVGRLQSAPVSEPISRPSTVAATMDPRSVGRSLNVENLLKGSVRRSGEQYRIAVQLISCGDGRELWSGVYTADISDIPGVEEQIVRHTADALRVPWSASLDQQWARRHVENPEAHDLYLQARYLWSTRNGDALERSVVLLQQAIAKDPSYARAYAGLADSYVVMATNNQQMPVATAVPLVRDAAVKALQLDPTLAEPHATLGLLKSKFDWDFAGAQEEFQRSIALNPGYATAHHWAGQNLTAMGQFEAANAELRKAQELDPLSPMIFEGLFENYYYWHRFDEAIQTMRALQARDPVEFESAPFSWAFAMPYLAKGMYPEAEAIYRQLADRYRIDVYSLRLAQAQALEGHPTEARALLERVERNPDYTADPVSLARVHLALGETDAAIAWLQRAYQERDPDVTIMKYDPNLAALAADPRFQQLVQNVSTRNERADSASH